MRLPRLLAGVERSRAISLDAHRAVHGDLPPLVSRRRPGAVELIEEVRRSGLRGRGGAGFPTATKLAGVFAARGRPVVVVNACEGEPASGKDRLLLERSPHLVIDGGLACAGALDADLILFAVDADAPAAKWAIQAALAERTDAGRRGLATEVVAIPAGYVSGQESSIVNFVNRGQAKPTAVPPMVFERGVARRPTLVSNAETVAQIALIARHGADWFAEVGTAEQPGSTLVTLSGAVLDPGVLEVEYGVALDSLIAASGGAVGSLRAVLFGGYGGTWVDADDTLGLAISERSLRARGATLGPGVIVALPASACPVTETARVAAWLANQGTRQCGPCVNGLAAIAATLESIADGRAPADASTRLASLARLVTRRGACAHPDGAARFVTSALRVFATEFSEHAEYGRCPACSQVPVLPLPERLSLAA